MHGLKEFQIRTLDILSEYLTALKAREREAQERNIPSYCMTAWMDMEASRPRLRSGMSPHGHYIDARDGMGQSVPNVCLKVPTGGGKTLLGVHAIGAINNQCFDRNTGLVVWIVPSETIYRQTLKAFKNPDHPYRKFLKLSAAGRLKVIRHTDHFTRLDVENGLTVMLLMLQSSNRETKDSLRMFQNRGGFTDFFPPIDDYQKSNHLKKAVPNLDVWKPPDRSSPLFNPLMIKHSLGNLMRLQRPIFIIDEGHRAYSDQARETITGFNPRFILELSATPTMEKSNILVNVSGLEVKAEEMIKLPINLSNIKGGDWRGTLRAAWEKIKDLQHNADTLQANTDRTIRPILLVQVERTGKSQRGSGLLHAEDARDYLTGDLGLRPDEVRVKSSDLDEIGNEDLLSPESPVRVVITKQALQEGWDCSFAYVLALLSGTTAPRALTQLIGRILRQPHAQLTGMDDLDQSWVFCHNQNVNDVVKRISEGLKREGLEDIDASGLQLLRDTGEGEFKSVEVRRRSGFGSLEILLPKVLHKDGKKWRRFSFDRDLLRHIPWNDISYSHNDTITVQKLESLRLSETQIDLLGSTDERKPDSGKDVEIEEDVSAAFFARSLSDIIPNPWQAARIAKETIDSLVKGGKVRSPYTRKNLHAERVTLLNELRCDLKRSIYGHYGDAGDIVAGKTENLFHEKFERGEITFHLKANGDKCFNWSAPKVITLYDDGKRARLNRENGEPIQRSLFERSLDSDYNPALEKPVAFYLDEHEAVKWWYRLIEKKDYALQGWRRNRVYPDFLAAYVKRPDEKECLAVLETKGRHLSGNDDTQYKKKLFASLERMLAHSINAGEVDVRVDGHNKTKFRIIMQDGHRSALDEVFRS